MTAPPGPITHGACDPGHALSLGGGSPLCSGDKLSEVSHQALLETQCFCSVTCRLEAYPSRNAQPPSAESCGLLQDPPGLPDSRFRRSPIARAMHNRRGEPLWLPPPP